VSDARQVFVAVALLLADAVGCGRMSRSDETKPEGVPSDAVSIGGVTKRQWAKCIGSSDAASAPYQCAVYGARGDVLASGRFSIVPPGSAFEPMANAEYLGWNGELFILSRSRRLVPVAPPRPPSVPPSARWSGGATCGAFFECSRREEKLVCRIYDETTGNLQLAGTFRELKHVDDRGDLRLCPANPTEIFQEGGGVAVLQD
jgi:hypothetical protein